MSYCFISLQLTNPSTEGKKLILPVLSPALSQGPALKDVQGDLRMTFHLCVQVRACGSRIRKFPPWGAHVHVSVTSQAARWPLPIFSNPQPWILFYKSPDCPITDCLASLDISYGDKIQKGEATKGKRYRIQKLILFLQPSNPSIILDDYPKVRLMDHMAVLFLIFWGTSILFSIVTPPIYIPTNIVQEFQFFSHPCQHYYLLFFWYYIHPNRRNMIFHCGFDFISLMINDVEHLFIYLPVGYLDIFEEVSVPPLLIGLFVDFLVEF